MPDRILTRPFGLLVTAHFLQALGFSSMLLLPLYLDFLGASRLEVGSVMAAASIGGLAGRPVIGWGLDVVGRKPVLIGGTIALVAGMVMVAAVTQIGLLAYAMRVLVGLGSGTLFTGYFAFAADLVPESRRTEGLALFGISGLVPLLVNPLADRVGVDPAQLRWFLPCVGGVIALSLPFLLAVPEPKVVRAPEQVSWAAVTRALGQRRLWPVWAATATFGGLVAVFMSFATVVAADRGIERPSSVWLTYACGAAAVRLFGARLPARLGNGRVGGFALACYASALLVAASASTERGWLIVGLLGGVGHGYCFPVLMGQTVTRSPAALRGVAVAAFTGLWGVARLLSAPSLGKVADVWDDATMLRIAGLTGLAGLVAWGLLERRIGGAAEAGILSDADPPSAGTPSES